jgi:hypothetical protein
VSKQKKQRDMGDAFGGFLNETAAESSNREMGVRSDAFDSVVNSDKTRYIDISKIEPDPMQPRRAIPHEIRQGWQLTAETMPAFLQYWSEQSGIDIRAVLESESDEDRPEPDNPSQAALLSLIDLASSIRRDGLQNPISVVYTVTGSYGIETGERRWLAYHILHSVYGDDYKLILVRQVNERNVWRQASENNARENLNAIARARQLAILLMDLHGMDNFQPLSSFEHEQDFYAQVAEGESWRIPRGKAGQVMTAMGFRQDDQLRKYRALLRLPHEAWQIADDKNITEYAIREMKNASGNDNDLIIKLVKNYTVSTDTLSPVDEDTVSTDTLSDENSVTPVTPSRNGWSDRLAKQTSSSRAFWQKARLTVDKLPSEARLQLRAAAEEQIALLNDLIETLKQSAPKK